MKRLRRVWFQGTEPMPTIKDELNKAEYEPLLPIEKKLIVWSLVLGVVLLVALAFLNRLFPPTL
jgi:hypothetical protein